MADSVALATARLHTAHVWTQDAEFDGLNDVTRVASESAFLRVHPCASSTQRPASSPGNRRGLGVQFVSFLLRLGFSHPQAGKTQTALQLSGLLVSWE